MYCRPCLGDNARTKFPASVTEPVWRGVAPSPVNMPTLIDSSLSPGHQVVVTQAQTVPAPAPAPAPSTVVVQNPDGSYSVAPITQSTMPAPSPELLALADEPGGTSGFNLAPGATGTFEPIDGASSVGGGTMLLIGGALLALLLFGGRDHG